MILIPANPAVFIQSEVQYVLAGNSTIVEASVYASPADSALVKWYHGTRFIDLLNVTDYSTSVSQDGDVHRLEIESVGETELGEYLIVVTLGELNASDEILLTFLGKLLVNPSLCYWSTYCKY